MQGTASFSPRQETEKMAREFVLERIMAKELSDLKWIETALSDSVPPEPEGISLEGLNVTEKVARALVKGIIQSNLPVLEFRGSLFDRGYPHKTSKESVRNRRILYDGICSSTALRHLEFGDIPFEEMDGLQIILTGLPSLDILKLENLELTDEMAQLVAQRIAELKVSCLTILFEWSEGILFSADRVRTWQILRDGLMASSSIRQLELKDLDRPHRWEDICVGLHRLTLECSDYHNVQDSQYSQLFQNVLIRSSSLSWLSLTCISLGNSGFLQFLEALRRNTSLVKLELHRCDINATRAKDLVRAIASHPRLRTLVLDEYSWRMGLDVVLMIAQNLRVHQSRLTHITLSSSFQPRGFVKMEQAVAQDKKRLTTVRALLECVKENYCIQSLDLIGNYVSEEENHEIFFYTTLNRLGRRLLSQDHRLASSVWTHVLAKCQTEPELKYSLTYFFLREQPTLVPHDGSDIIFTNNKRRRIEN